MTSFFNPDRFLEILQPDRCPLCFLTRDYGQTYLRNILNEGVTDPHTRGRSVKSQGFCRRHAWHAVAQSQSLGMSIPSIPILLADGLTRLKSLSRWWEKKNPPARFARRKKISRKSKPNNPPPSGPIPSDSRSAFESAGDFLPAAFGKKP